MNVRVLLLVFLCWLWVTPSLAQLRSLEPLVSADSGEQAPLRLEEVLRSLDQSHPGLEVASRVTEVGRAQVFAARGVFDPVLSVDSSFSVLGYYQNRLVGARVTQLLPLWGTELFAGYRIARGTFPIYKGDQETLSAGELRAGANVPLWKDRDIDSRRAQLEKSEELLEAARCAQNSGRLALRMLATSAYYGWVASGQVVQIQRRLLDVARRRADALETQVQLGSIAAVVVVDNQRLVLEREAKLIAAQRKFNEATLQLALFLRDDVHEPQLISAGRLPQQLPRDSLRPLTSVEQDIERALRSRPELCEVSQQLAAAQVDVRWRENQVAPALDAKAYVSRDYGQGPEALAETELTIGLSLDMPLTLRQARGEERKARAHARALEAKARWLRDAIATEVQKLRVHLEASEQQLSLATRQADTARQLAEAERIRFAEGATDLVIVNIRELAEADATQLEVEAAAAYHEAWVTYRLATNLDGPS